MAKQIQPYAETAKSYVSDSRHFLEIMKTMTTEPNDLVVSFDVVSLFTNIRTKKATDIGKENTRSKTTYWMWYTTALRTRTLYITDSDTDKYIIYLYNNIIRQGFQLVNQLYLPKIFKMAVIHS